METGLKEAIMFYVVVLQGVLDRFSQIEPKLIFSINAVVYNGKVHDHMCKLTPVAKGMFTSICIWARSHFAFAFALVLISFDVCRYLPSLSVNSTIEMIRPKYIANANPRFSR